MASEGCAGLLPVSCRSGKLDYEYGRCGVAVRNVSKNEPVARDLIKFMTSPEAAALLRKSAMEPPAR
jgi:ABC-type molybdate transport system substrate-binding protein